MAITNSVRSTGVTSRVKGPIAATAASPARAAATINPSSYSLARKGVDLGSSPGTMVGFSRFTPSLTTAQKNIDTVLADAATGSTPRGEAVVALTNALSGLA